MALTLPVSNKTEIVRLTKALYDAAPGYTYLFAFEESVKETNITTFANWLASTVSSDAAVLSATVVASLKLTGSAAVAATAFLDSQFAANPGNYGKVILDAMNALALPAMTSDATFGAAATAFNTSVSYAYTYSINPANTTMDLATLQAADEGPNAAATTLTVGQDNLLGGNAADLFNAYLVNNANTLQSGDVINGGAGTDTLQADIVPQTVVIAPTTFGVENAVFRVQANQGESGDNHIANKGIIDAERMSGVLNWEDKNSRADLVIEDVRIADTQVTKDITITMRDTDSGDVDYGFYFDQNSLRTVSHSSSQINLRVLDTYSTAQGLAPLKDSPYGSFSFFFSADKGVTYNKLTLASQAMQDAQTFEEMVTALQAQADVAFGLGVVNVVKGAAYTIVDPITTTTVTGYEINLSTNADIQFDTTRAGSGWLATETVPAVSNFYTNYNTNAATSVELVTSQVVLDNVGRDCMGGALIVGGMATDTCYGVQQFNITVEDNSALTNIQSTKNSLQVVNIVNGTTDEMSSAYTTVVANAGNLTVKGGTAGTDLPGVAASTKGFTDVRVINGSAMTGKLDFTAEVTSNSIAKYLNLKDGAPAAPAADNVAFIYSGGINNDTMDVVLDSAVVGSTNTLTGREDFTFTANGGNGNDKITLQIGGNTTANWYADQKSNANITINADAGNDTIWSKGAGDVKINAGTGDDTVYADNSGTIATSWSINDPNAVPDGADLVTAGAWAGFMYNGKLTVTFSGAGAAGLGGAVTSPAAAAYANGYEVTVSIPTGTNYSVNQLYVNQAIKTAINSDPVLSKLLSAVDGPSNTLVISSLIDGAFNAADLLISVASTDVTTLNASEQATVLAAYKLFSANSAAVIATAQAANAAEVTALNLVPGMDVAQVLVGGTTGAISTALSDNTINLGAGNDVAVLGTGANSNDTLVWTGYDQGKDTIVNFEDGTVTATAADKLNFTSYLVDKESASGSVESQKRIATTLNANAAIEANSVTVLSTPLFTATDTFAGLTAAKLLAAVNSTNLGAANYAGISAATLDAVTTYVSSGAPTTLVGGIGHAVVAIENNLNLGEYALYELTFNGLATNLTADFSACTAIGSVDFGATITPAAGLLV